MRAALRYVAVLAVLLLTAGLAHARPVSEAEREALVQTVDDFNAAMAAGDYQRLVDTVPPRVVEHIAKQANVDAEMLRKVMLEQITQAMASVKIEAFAMDMDAASDHELPGGEPYALIPTRTVMDTGASGKFEARSDTLAFLDEGTWYLVRVSEADQVKILREVYPEFAAVEFAAGTMEAVQP
ncbi:MAG: hypothetical protein AB7I52_02315 [Rhizobiaceae bacterium]